MLFFQNFRKSELLFFKNLSKTMLKSDLITLIKNLDMQKPVKSKNSSGFAVIKLYLLIF